MGTARLEVVTPEERGRRALEAGFRLQFRHFQPQRSGQSDGETVAAGAGGGAQHVVSVAPAAYDADFEGHSLRGGA
jgi:hypothetical protein